MRRFFISPLLAAVLLTSCVSTPNGKVLDPKLMAAIAQEATRIGASTVLKAHPEYRPQFETARQSVALLLALGNANIDQITAVLAKLPIYEGNQGEIGIIILSGAIRVWGFYGEAIMELDKTSSFTTYVKPVAEGILAGIDQAVSGVVARPLARPPR